MSIPRLPRPSPALFTALGLATRAGHPLLKHARDGLLATTKYLRHVQAEGQL